MCGISGPAPYRAVGFSFSASCVLGTIPGPGSNQVFCQR
jgi:hypothetical protein